jgi:DNA mismatch repair ATPase MutS
LWEKDYSDLSGMIRPRLQLLDFYCGMAKGIKKHSLKAPQLVNEPNVFSLTESKPFAQHSYYEPYLQGAVAQSFWIDPAKPMVVVIGPNSSGKSVAFFNAYANAFMGLKGLYVSGDLRMSQEQSR